MTLFDAEEVALVTGAGRGIGRAVALDLAAEGARVVVNYARNEEAANSAVEKIRAAGGTAVAHRADIADERQVQAMFRFVAAEFGRLDVLVANAGITEDGFVLMMSKRKWANVVDTNLTGTFLCCREALKVMARRRSGAIVTISSVSGILGNEGQANYAAAKAGIIALTRSLAREGAGHGVRANVVAPGLIETDMIKRLPREAVDLYLGAVAMHRLGTPEEVASVVSFLASSRASFVTGKVIGVDGGLPS